MFSRSGDLNCLKQKRNQTAKTLGQLNREESVEIPLETLRQIESLFSHTFMLRSVGKTPKLKIDETRYTEILRRAQKVVEPVETMTDIDFITYSTPLP